jgi:thioredoxin reductase (NADPH)
MRKTPGKKTEKNDEESWFIPMDARHTLFDMFKELENDVILEVFTKKGENDPYNDVTVKFTTDLAKLSAKIKVSFHTIGEARSKEQNVVSSPSVLINPDRFNIRYTGAPAGEEGTSLIETIMTVSRGESGLSEKSKQMLAEFKEKRHVRVFVTLACPYCPRQVLNGFRAAIERPDLVSAECVATYCDKREDDQHRAGARGKVHCRARLP